MRSVFLLSPSSTTRSGLSGPPSSPASPSARLCGGRDGSPRSAWLALGLSLAVAMPVAAAPGGATAAGPAFAPGRILVEARTGVSDEQLGAALAGLGARSQGRLRGMATHMVSVPPGQSEEAFARRVAQHPQVRFAELDRRIAPGAVTTNDPMLSSQWHLNRIQAPDAWTLANGQGAVIAILDSGVDGAHPDLAPQLVPGWNFYDNNADTSDVYGHGTKVAGAAVAAANNAAGGAGVAWGARLMPVRVAAPDGWAYFSTIAQGLTWAAQNGAHVANISFSDVSGSATVLSAADQLRARGGLVVASAGNSGVDPGTAATGSMIVVSATGSGDTITSWSNFGAAVDIAAPGEGIVTTVKGGGYGSVSGTSFSAPIVAGVVAMIKARRPDLTPAQVEAALFGGANDLGAAGKDPQYGHGRVNANGALAAADGVSGDTAPPTAAVSAPLGGTVGGTVTVTASATDNIAVARVDLLVNGQAVASDSSAPYSFAWDSTRAANGNTTIAVKAYDNAGNSGLSNAVTLTVSNVTVADTTPPAVSILSPVSGSAVGGTTSITASASDAGGIASMKVYIDGKLEASGTSSSISLRWNSRKATTGNHTIQVVAADRAGNQSSQSVSVKK